MIKWANLVSGRQIRSKLVNKPVIISILSLGYNMLDQRIIVATGMELRHRYFAGALCHQFPLLAVFGGSQEYRVPTPSTPAERLAWDWFFSRREEYENRTFKPFLKRLNGDVPEMRDLPENNINSRRFEELLLEMNPDLIVLFDTHLAGERLMKQWPNRILNLHLGLTEHYRGSSSNFWPIYDKRLDRLGATIILINQGIDTGVILKQGVINIHPEDTEQDLMGKPIILGTELMIQVLRAFPLEASQGRVLTKRGKLYLKRDLIPEAVLKVKQMSESRQLKELIDSNLSQKMSN